MALGTVKFGIDYELEDQASSLLMDDRKGRGLKGVKSLSEEYCWLSHWQLDERLSREVYNHKGIPDVHLYSGLFQRVYNPLIGKRPKRGQRDV